MGAPPSAGGPPYDFGGEPLALSMKGGERVFAGAKQGGTHRPSIKATLFPFSHGETRAICVPICVPIFVA